ncbi:amino acid adenylation domain-containing protein [Ectopseudomonas mendocina]|uniref:Amino acid adenylation domain-containing protein n=1 Tax=Ectopseudomonas mendocina TaxID=300 RepID=A0A379IWT6_ECTME|nr:non-ribosomal peptide synthase/polyketide synthase [Pseudomonas mendocina]SUD40757.1 amino acid adenylation domain-containing protein [Pseudomonas mendocina]
MNLLHDKALLLSRRFLGLGPQQRRAFLDKLREQGLDASSLPIPAGVADAQGSVLSYSQQRLWFLEHLQPGNSAYHLPGALQLTGPLDEASLLGAFEDLAQRHPSLRTCFFADADGNPRQRVEAAPPLTLQALQGDDFAALAREFAQRPFDLEQAPLWRMGLWRQDGQSHAVLICLHHIIADGWSIQVLLTELAQFYRARVQGEPAALVELALSYADVALWQRACLDAGESDRQLAYWREQLGDEHPLLELPCDHPRPAQQSFRGARLAFAIAPALAARVRELARQQVCTPFTVLLAAYKVLLQRLSGQRDLRVGVPIAGRTQSETQGLIGFFVNTQVLRSELSGAQSFNELLAQVLRTAQGAQAHQALPFEHLVEALAPERSLSHNPLFQVLYNHQQRPDEALQLTADLRAELMPLDSGSAQFDLALHTWEGPGDVLAGNWNYALDLFEPASIERLHQRFIGLLKQLLAQPQLAIGEHRLDDEIDRQALAHFNATAVDYGVVEPVQRQFEKRVQAHPQAIALVCGEQRLSYAELDLRANQLAHHLQKLGVSRDSLVGVAAQRSVEMVMALYAILKAGGAYVPMDPEYPAERLRYMLEDSGVSLLLSHDAVIDSLPHVAGVQVLNLDYLDLSQEPQTAPEVDIHPEQLAYLIYTSGSTGKPKGAGNSHAALYNRLAWMQQAYNLTAEDRVLQKTPFSFDVSVWEFFWPLISGARLVMAQPGDHRDPTKLVELIEREQISTLHFVPSMLAAFVGHGELRGCESLRRIVCSGEALPAELASNTRQLLPQAELYNLYGPTEAAIDVTHWQCTGQERRSVPIGQPIANLQIHILDERLNPQPIGVAGELYIGGIGLARGYHRRPGLTAERFIASPFGAGQRLYRSGDLARWTEEGVLEYLGRIDHQVKLRGLRIELGEIEAALLEHPALREAVVLVRDQQLVAYVVGGDYDEVELRAQLKQRLPEFMLPSHVMQLERLPLSPNGKLERKALPEPERIQRDYQAPRPGLESQLASIWQELLGVERVGRDDNFFELGGDSILSLQIIARARRQGIELTPRQLFERQSIAELAQVATRSAETSGCVIDSQRDIPLTPIQHWFFAQPMNNRQHWNQSVLLSAREPLQPQRLSAALQAVLEQHDALHLRFQQQGDSWRQRYAAEAETLELRVERCSLAELSALCDEVQASLDLSHGPLLRAVLVQLHEGGERLLLVVHHLAIDGVSWRILLDDLQRAYAQLGVGAAADLGRKSSAWQSWSERLAAYASSPEVAAERAYWQALPADRGLPCDHPQGRNLTACTEQLQVQLDPSTTEALLTQAPAAYRTQINDLLLSALAHALRDWNGQAQTLIALEGHGREGLFEELDLSQTLGWFTSLYPLLLQAGDDWDETLKSTKENLRQVPRGGIGYGLLKYLQGEDLPALDDALMFNYLGRMQTSGQLFDLAEEASGAQRDASAPLACALALDGRVTGGCLQFTCTFSHERFNRERIVELLEAYRCALVELVQHCRTQAAFTPSDFAFVPLSQTDLDSLPLPARQIEDIYPLTPMQQGLLFHSELQAADGAYVNQLSLEIEGLPVARFKAAWAAALQRHPLLRAAFLRLGADQQVVQLVQREAQLTIRELEGSDFDLQTLLREERETPFDLTRPPLMRLVLVRLGEGRHQLIWTLHHILLDGWSSAALLAQVLQDTRGEGGAQEVGHYPDYLAWLQRQDLAVSEAFWRQQLQGFDEPTLLAGSLRSGQPDGGSGVHVLNLPRGELEAFAKARRITLNTLIQATWTLLLQRYCGRRQVAFGATVAGRPASVAGIEHMLGLFINTLPVVQAPQPHEPVGDWLDALQAHNLALREHEQVPLFRLQQLAGHAGRELFDTLLVFENYPVDQVLQGQGDGLRFTNLQAHEQTHYPLSLAVMAGNELQVHWHYQRAHFSDRQIAGMSRQFERLLQALCADAQRCIGELPLLDASEVAEVEAWNDPTPVPNDIQLLPERIAEQACLRPEAVALVHGQQRLSFAELEARANRLAHQLIARGVGAEVRVGVALERGIELFVALLAVLKAGGAYVPLDPDYPEERLRYMLEDAGVKLLLSHQAALPRLPDVAGIEVLDLDHLPLNDQPEQAPEVNIHPEQLAYLIYTSGSTGKPKGVAVAHGAIALHCQAIGERYELTAEDRELHFLSVSFDGAHERWLTPLSHGARVVIRDQQLWSVQQTYDCLIEEGISVVALPPSYLRQLAEWAEQCGQAPGVKTYCFAGEAFSRELLQQVIRSLQPQWIINGYGPTETVVTPTIWRVPAATADFTTAYAPIGDRVGARQGYVLDADLNLLPVGVAGELYLGGLLARGYLDRPGATAERFVPNPYRAGERLYRTGDRVRLGHDGQLEYLGRLDQQIKLRGFRIEIGEVEAALKACAGVGEALVVVKDSAAGKRLVGYVSGEGLSESELKAQLKQRLPAYMVPSHILALERIPLLPNGKLDRQSLPEPQVEAGEYQAPRTAQEQLLAELWSELLGIAQISRDDHFFELGGHSLLATQLISRLRHSHGLDVPLRAIFEAPRLCDLAVQLQQAGQAADLPLRARGVRAQAAQSFAQQRLWFLQQLAPTSSAYHLPGVLRLRGEVDEGALQHAFEALAERHWVLRSTFAQDEQGQPLQCIQAQARVNLQRLQAQDEHDFEVAARAFMDKPFDLQQSPPWRLALVTLAQGEQRLLLCLHHLLSDGWSVQILLAEFTALYNAARSGVPAELPSLAVQYADYAEWQRQWLAGGEGERQLAYWREQLGDEQPLLELPTDHPRPAQQSFRGARVHFKLDAVLGERLREQAKAHNATPFMLLLAAYKVLLLRISGQRDLRVGVPIAGRTRREVEGLIGLFVNTQVLRSQVAPELSFTALLDQLKHTSVEAQAHQDLPFEQLVEALQPERSLSHNPLFQVAYDHQQISHAALSQLQGLQAEVMSLADGSAQFDLALNTQEDRQGQFSGNWNYALDLFEPASIERLHQRFIGLLKQLLAQPHLAIGEHRLDDEIDRQALAHFNATAVDYGVVETVQRQFEKRVQAHPQAIALVCGEQSLSYAELDQRANQLAHHLQALGVTRDSLVGVAALRSVEMVVALYAILKAGGAYVPMDPEYPSERLRYMLEDAGVSLLLSHDAVIDSLPLVEGVQLLNLDQLDLSQAPKTAPEVAIHPEQLAYLIYTSGSTGKPKGAGNSHAALYNRLAWMQDAYRLTADDRVLQKTPFSFDVSVWEFFWPLITGARLVMAQPGDHRDPAKLIELIESEQISTLHFVPSMLAAFVAHSELSGCASLRRIVCSGEALPAELASSTRHLLPQAELYNLYGPTEAAIDVTHWQCTGQERRSVPIGQPIANLQIHILDERLNPQPIGVAGELYIGGIGLARGYHRRPGLTAERFVASPFGDGQRLYRSGDLARWTEDGVLEYLGRIDHQVKLRGLRIELGEIEAALLEHPALREAVVLVRDVAGSPQLVAYVVGEAFDEEALRAQLKQRLPEFMVPSYFVALDRLPLSPNGKLERKALPEPERIQRDYQAPRPGLESQLAAIWQELLGVERVGREDDFFALGGHSLLATQLVSQIRRELQRELPLRSAFEASSLRAQAVQLAAAGAAPQSGLQARQREALSPQSFAQQRLWFLAQLEPDSLAYNLPGAVRLRGVLDMQALQRSFDTLAQRHESLRTTFASGPQGEPLQCVHGPVPVAIEHIQALDEVQMRQAVDDFNRRPFDLEQSPAWRVALIEQSSQQHVLVLCLHHIIADGWSIQVLLDEFAGLYRGYVQGQPAQLAALPIQYADYAIWQREYLNGSRLAEQVQWWREQLGDEQPVLELPSDRPRPALRLGQGARHAFSVPAGLVERLREQAQAHEVTPFMLILAAYQSLLYRLSGQRDLRVGVPVAGRTQGESEGLIGLFVNTLVIRSEVAAQDSFAALLRQVKARVVGAQANQDVPFEQLVDALQPERSLSHNPLFQVAYNHQRQDQRALQTLPGLQCESLNYQGQSAQFDLVLGTVEEADGRFEAYLDYATDLFEAATVERLAGQFLRLLDGACQAPQSALCELPLLSESEVAAVESWNDRAPNAQAVQLLPQRIAEQARLRPEAIALVHGQQRLSFAELEARANGLAQQLIARGVGAEVRVGVALERGTELFVALLAVLKASGAYVPLDPDYPEERLRYMLEDAGVKLLLSHQAALPRVPQVEGIEVLDLDHLQLSDEPVAAPEVELHPEQLAYLIYTSGSTGKPKGVAVSHGAIALHCQAIGERYELTAEDRELHFLSVSFDGAHERWLTPLSHGARVVIRDQQLWSVQQTYDCLIEEGISVVALPPSYLRQLAEWAEQCGQAPGVKTYCFAGEAFSRELLQQVIRSLQPQWIINGYGPTETVVTPTIWRVPAATADFTTAYAPIGDRVGARQGYVLDADLNLLPVGVAGELYLGGLLARGYLDRPGATAERFVPNPYRAGERLYRTGDRVRLGADGQLEYLGRLDQQIKLRGFRIEIGEVEAALKACAGVGEALVVVKDSAAGKRLVGYVSGEGLSESQLKAQLKQRLPAHMVPSHILALERMPLLPNGKLDRQSLPEPQVEGGEYQAPHTAQEQLLAELWGELLGIEKISRDAQFFALGGDSIQSLSLVTRLRKVGWELTPKAIFQHPRLADLAALMTPVSAAPMVVPRAVGELTLTPIQAHFFSLPMANRAHWNQALLLEVRRPLQAEHLQHALQGLIEHHDALRLAFREDRSEGWQAFYRDEERAERLFWQRRVESDEALQALCEAAQRSLDLQHGPLLRVLLADLPDGSQRLLLAAHHLIVDGVSWRVLLDDLARAYQQVVAGQPVELGDRPGSYQAWAEHLWRHAQAAPVAGEMDYWLAQRGSQRLPVDDPSGTATHAQVQTCTWQLSEAQTRRLLRETLQQDARMDEVLLAALAEGLRRWAGLSDSLIALEGHGREWLDEQAEQDLARTLGWFTSLYPLHLQAQETLPQTLAAVRQRLRSVPNKGLGYGLLRYLGNAEQRRSLAELGEADIAFNYLGQFDAQLGDGHFAPASESPGTLVDPATALTRELEINGQVFAGCLSLSCRFSGQRHRVQRIEALLAAMGDALQSLIDAAAVESAPRQSVSTAATPSPLLRLNQAEVGRPTLFCVHPVSGTLVGYYPLARALAPHWQVFGLQNRQLLQPSWRDQSLEQMARDYVKVMLETQPQGAYHLLGWSMGGALVLAMARLLERLGKAVAFVGLVDGYVPGAGLARAPRAAVADEAAPGDDDWQQLLALERHMHTLAAQHQHIQPLRCPVQAWWAAHSPENNRNGETLLETALGRELHLSSWVQADHLGIVRDQSFIEHLSRQLAALEQSSRPLGLESHDYAN